ncbi:MULTISPECIES: polysaccharide biosynthesis tyrosine autokinase [Methylobacter]|uniref:polysaccharide biosynthesis tyrosine autokinase n=1 Tax=Methylobacter TaxID=429 RepID=UPI000375F244|nr:MULTISPECIES: polysaccharide biosynthesis tyrosine autokinase [Methylobacter]
MNKPTNTGPESTAGETSQDIPKSSEDNGGALLKKSQDEVIRLRREMQRIKQEQELLGKLGFNREPPEMPAYFAPPPSFNTSHVALGEFLATLADAKGTIAKITVLFVLIGAVYLLTAQPVYRVDALLETGMRMDLLADISKGFKEETVVNEEIEILQSRKLLGQVVDELKLDIIAQPVHFPIIGAPIARMNNKIRSLIGPSYKPGLPFFDLNAYAWNSENITVETFDVPAAYIGRPFTLIVEKGKRYRLLDEDGNLLTEGEAGVLNTNWLPSDDTTPALLISSIKGKAGTHFDLMRIAPVDAITRLSEFLTVMEKGLGSGVVQISLEGPDKDQITLIVNRMVKTFTTQERERKSEKISLSLDYMEKQMPELKEKAEKAEAALHGFRQRHGAVDLTKETQILLERMVGIEAELSEFRRKRTELLPRFTPQHSSILALNAHIANLNGELSAIKNKVKNFPNTEQEVLRLSRDAELYSQLYAFLRNRIGQLKVVQEAPVGYVGVVDLAVPSEDPIKPQKAAVMGLSVTLGLFIGLGAAFLQKSLHQAVKDPEIIEKQLGLPVYATVPHSVKQRKSSKKGDGTRLAVLAETETSDPAVESLRSLRTSLHFVLLESQNNIIMVTGPSPGIGKSFLSVNFSAVMASAGKRVLLIDADMRKGHLHKYFDLEGTEGLSDAIATGKSIAQVVRRTHIDGLEVICNGTMPPNPSELLSHERFVTAIEKISLLYDYVIIDSPPVLPVTDPAIIGRLAGAALLVVKAGSHTLREIEQSVKHLKLGGVNLRGVVFNDMPVSTNRYGYGGYYGYAYTYAYADSTDRKES